MSSGEPTANLASRSTDSLVKRLLASIAMRDWEDEPNPDEAIVERKALMDEITKRPDAIPLVLPLLKHQDWVVRRNSVNMLGRLQAREAIAELNTMLQEPLMMSGAQYIIVAALENIATPEALAIAQEWRRYTDFSKRDEVSEKLGDYRIYGTTDQAFEARLHEVAARRGLAPNDLIKNRLFSMAERSVPKPLPPHLQAYFDNLRENTFTEADLLYLEG